MACHHPAESLDQKAAARGWRELADNRESTDASERPIGEPKLPSTQKVGYET
jgi:hypothetical protein